MYPNIENHLKPFAMKEGRSLKLFLCMFFLMGLLSFLVVRFGDGLDKEKKIFVAVAALSLLYLIALPVGRIRTNRKIKSIMDGYGREQLHRIELECTQIDTICGLAITSQAIISEMSMIPIADIVWIRQQNDTIKGVATMNFLIVVDKEKKQHRIFLSTKAGPFRSANSHSLQKIEERIRKYSPGIYWGNSKELQKMYRNNFPEMVAHVQNHLS